MIITPFYAGLLALWFLILSLRVVNGRRSTHISLADGGDAGMLRIIRAQANFAEYVPLALLLIALLELSHYSRWLLHALGIMLLTGRLLHGYALGFTEQFFVGRSVGIVLTFLVLLIAGGLCIYQGVLGFTLT